MYRARLERLEERKMFSVTDLIIDPFSAYSVSPAAVDEGPAIVDYIDEDTISTRDNIGRLNIVGDFNGDGKDDLAAIVINGRAGMSRLAGDFNGDGRDDLAEFRGGSNLIIVVCSRSPSENLLPYVEQDNVYKLSDAAPNGIIAVLIGVAADPTDPSGNTAIGTNFTFADGSVHFSGTDVIGTASLSASLLASDEYFAKFSNTTLDDEATIFMLLGDGDVSRRVTHDTDFEKWADAHHSDRDSYRERLEDVLVSGILHEENEFSFPRMFRGGVTVS